MTAVRIDDATYSIEDGFVRCFLIIGGERALLVDSGVSGRDHIAGNTAFGHFMMHPAEAANYYNINGGKGDFTPLADGQVLELGGRRIEVVLIPGHTPGSIALLDEDRRMLFPGDSVQDGDIYMFGPMREMHAYIHSLEKLEAMSTRFDHVHPSHGSLSVDKSIIPVLAMKARRCLEGKLEKTCNEGPALPRGETREDAGRTDGRDACHET